MAGRNEAAARTAAIQWLSWDEAAFRRAAETGRPVLLSLTAFWCEWSRRMAATTWSDPAVVARVEQEFVAIHVDSDRYPHILERYVAGGWPTTAFLTPTGEVLWSGTFLEATDLLAVADSVLQAWRDRRAELEQEIGRRTRAMEAGRGRPAAGMVRREPADDVLTAVRAQFDALNGGFGDAPKFPQPEAIELLYAHAGEDEAWLRMADLTLDGMLAGQLWDAVDGGFFRYAMAADWTAPRYEKMLDVNAGLLEAYALGAMLRGREDWRSIAERTVDWAETTLAADGLWCGSQAAAPLFFRAAPGERAAMEPPPVDGTVFTAAAARWIGALGLAGARLDRPAWVERAMRGMDALLESMAAPNGGLYHFRAPGEEPRLDYLLIDTLETARAALALAQATGSWAWVETARSLARHMESAYWAEEGGFHDRVRQPGDVGALRYLDCAFEPNAVAARLLVDLTHLTGERHWRALAERTLARVAGPAGRYGPAAAAFALATEEFFDPPPTVFIATPSAPAEAAALRAAAFALPVAALRVWTVPAGHTSGPERFDAQDVPLAWVRTRRGLSNGLASPAQLAAAGAGMR
jgi:uncharacterized protein